MTSNFDIHTHPLLGTWRPNDDSDLSFDEFQFFVTKSRIEILGYDFYDGESYFISDVNWTSDAIEFSFFQMSTAIDGKIKFKHLEAKKCQIFYSMTFRSSLKRIDGRQLKKKSKKISQYLNKMNKNKYHQGDFVSRCLGLWRRSDAIGDLQDYVIYLKDGDINIHSIDLYDGEEMVGENVRILNNNIVFEILTKSTGRTGNCKLASCRNNNLLNMEYSFSTEGVAHILTKAD